MPIIVKQSVAHGRLNLDVGEIRDDLTAAEVKTLTELGFVGEHTPEPEQSDEDLIGAKMEPEVQNKMGEAPVENKMEPAPANKSKKK